MGWSKSCVDCFLWISRIVWDSLRFKRNLSAFKIQSKIVQWFKRNMWWRGTLFVEQGIAVIFTAGNILAFERLHWENKKSFPLSGEQFLVCVFCGENITQPYIWPLGLLSLPTLICLSWNSWTFGFFNMQSKSRPVRQPFRLGWSWGWCNTFWSWKTLEEGSCGYIASGAFLVAVSTVWGFFACSFGLLNCLTGTGVSKSLVTVCEGWSVEAFVVMSVPWGILVLLCIMSGTPMGNSRSSRFYLSTLLCTVDDISSIAKLNLRSEFSSFALQFWCLVGGEKSVGVAQW